MDKKAKLLFLQNRAPALQKLAADIEEEATAVEEAPGQPPKPKGKRKREFSGTGVGLGLGLPAAAATTGLVGGGALAALGTRGTGRLVGEGYKKIVPEGVRGPIGSAAKKIGEPIGKAIRTSGKVGLAAGGLVLSTVMTLALINAAKRRMSNRRLDRAEA